MNFIFKPNKNLNKIVFSLISVVLISSCAKKDDYNLVIPNSSSETFTQKKTANKQSFVVAFKKDSSGKTISEHIHKTVIVEGTERDSLKTLKQRAKEKIVLEATEEINGVLIQSTSILDTTSVRVEQGGSNQNYSRQDLTQEAVSQTAGIARIIELNCKTLPTENNRLLLECEGYVTVPLIETIVFEEEI